MLNNEKLMSAVKSLVKELEEGDAGSGLGLGQQQRVSLPTLTGERSQRVARQASMRTQSTPGGMTRREALRLGLLGAGGMGLLGSDLLARTASRPASGGKGKAKSVIQIWMWGGPPHTDTFDPKPDAGRDYCGPLSQVAETNVPGIQIGQLLPRLAQMADKYSIIRSMTHGVNSHETASCLVQTGRGDAGSIPLRRLLNPSPPEPVGCC